jgi:hypothetical protein
MLLRKPPEQALSYRRSYRLSICCASRTGHRLLSAVSQIFRRIVRQVRTSDACRCSSQVAVMFWTIPCFLA